MADGWESERLYDLAVRRTPRDPRPAPAESRRRAIEDAERAVIEAARRVCDYREIREKDEPMLIESMHTAVRTLTRLETGTDEEERDEV